MGTPTPSCRRPFPFSFSTFKRAQVMSRTCGAVKERRSHLLIPMGRAPSSSGSWLGLCTRAPSLATIKSLAAGESRFATELLARPANFSANSSSSARYKHHTRNDSPEGPAALHLFLVASAAFRYTSRAFSGVVVPAARTSIGKGGRGLEWGSSRLVGSPWRG